jgi:hypothetical protein
MNRLKTGMCLLKKYILLRAVKGHEWFRKLALFQKNVFQSTIFAYLPTPFPYGKGARFHFGIFEPKFSSKIPFTNLKK